MQTNIMVTHTTPPYPYPKWGRQVPFNTLVGVRRGLPWATHNNEACEAWPWPRRRPRQPVKRGHESILAQIRYVSVSHSDSQKVSARCAHFIDNNPGDQRLLHDSGWDVSEATLWSFEVLHWLIPVENWKKEINEVAKERDYKNRYTINITKEALGDAESIIKLFFEE